MFDNDNWSVDGGGIISYLYLYRHPTYEEMAGHNPDQVQGQTRQLACNSGLILLLLGAEHQTN